MKAVVPSEMPPLPEGMNGWAMSTKRAGGMFHAHVLGFAACGTIVLDRHKSLPARDVQDMKYFGVCPRCYRKAMAALTANP